MRRDLLCGAVLLGIVACFWVQRDYSGELTAAFPDLVLVVIVLLGVGVIARALLRGGEVAQRWDGDGRFLAAALVVLPAWALGVGMVGFTISSVVVFVVVAQLIRRGRPQLRLVAMDTGVAVSLVVACFLVFTKVLLVPLPVSVLIGM